MSELHFLVVLISGVVGLAVGSFLNVVAHRVPLGLALSHPPSRCPGCRAPIAPKDNIPVVSWIVLRGRCRGCGESISVQYPLVELANAALWTGLAVAFGPVWILPAYLWFSSVGLVLIVTDLEHHRLPNRIVLHGTWIGVALLLGGGLLDGVEPVRFAHGALGGVAWFGLMLLIAIAVRAGFGFGDVKLAFLLGVFVAFRPLLLTPSWLDALGAVGVAVFGSFFLGGAAAIGLLALGRAEKGREIAFGPAMIVASWIAVIWGDSIAAAWLG